MLQKLSTLIGQLGTVHICDWLTKVKKIYEPGMIKSPPAIQDAFQMLLHVELTLQEAASGKHPKWQGGGQILPAPIKTSLEAILTQFFDITLIGGQK